MKAFLTLAVFFHLYLGALRAQNVGIGTHAPQSPLHVKTNGGEALRLQSSDPFIAFYDNSSNYGAYIWLNKLFGNDLRLGTPQNSNISIALNPNNTPVLYASFNGRVGIATFTPAVRLDVLGTDGWNLVDGEGDVRIGNANYRLKMGVALGGGGAGQANIMQSGGVGALSMGAGNKYLLQLNGPAGFVDFSNNTGGLRINGNAGTSLQVLSSNGTSSGALWRSMHEMLGRNIVQPLYETGSLYILNDETVNQGKVLNFNLSATSSVFVWGDIRLKKSCFVYPCYSSVRVKILVDNVMQADWEYTGTSLNYAGSPTWDYKSAGPEVFELPAGQHTLTYTLQSQQGSTTISFVPQIFIVSK